MDITRFIYDHHFSFHSFSAFEDMVRGERGAYSREQIDLDGDGERELLITGRPYDEIAYLAIFKYHVDHTSGNDSGCWEESFFIGDEARYSASVYYEFVAGQLIINSVTGHGIISQVGKDWLQVWVRCARNGCREVWSGYRMHIGSEFYGGDGGLFYNLLEYKYTTIDQFDGNHIQVTKHHFALRDFPEVSASILDLDQLRADMPAAGRAAGPEMRENYEWDGERYQLVSQEEIAPGVDIVSDFDGGTQEAISWWWDKFEESERTGTEPAESWGVPNSQDPSGYVWNMGHVWPAVAALNQKTLAGAVTPENFPLCRISVHEYVGGKFHLVGRTDAYCTRKFTRLEWADVDEDGKQELLLLTHSAETETGIQRLTVFRVQGGLVQIAQVDGVVNGADGVGVKWEKRREGFVVLAGFPLGSQVLDDLILRSRFETILPGNWMRDYTPPCANPWSNLGQCLVTRHFQEFRWDPKSQSFVP